MADTVAVMNAGRVEQLGAPADLYENPRHHLRRQLPRHLQPHRGRGRGDERRRRGPHGGRRQAAAARRPLLRADDGRRQAAGRRPPREDLPGARRRRGDDPRRPQPHHRHASWTPASSASPRSTSSTAPSARASRSTPRTSSATPAWSPAPRSSCTGTRRTPSASTPRQDIDAGVDTADEGVRVTATQAPPPRPYRRPPSRTNSRPARSGAQAARPVLAAAARHPLAARLLRAAARLPGVDVRPDRLPGRGLQGHLALPDLLGRAREYWPQFLRSLLYAGTATVLCLLLGYPLAYLIAFRAGRWRNLMLILVIAPFFTSFLIRTLAWKTILADGGPVVGVLNTLHVLDVTSWLGLTEGDRVLATPARGGLRTDVQLPAVHDPAALHLAGAHRRPAARGRGRPLRPAVHHLPPGDVPAVHARRRLRHPAHLHPGERRLRQRRTARLHRHQDDRQRHPVAVPAGPRLPDGRRALVHPHGGRPGDGHLLHPQAGTEDLL